MKVFKQLLSEHTQILSGLSRLVIILIAATTQLVVFDSCNKSNDNPEQEAARSWENKVRQEAGLTETTITELKAARSASSRYQNLNNALADGYADINVVRPNMGYHFLRNALLDTVFDPAKPEILVYNKNEQNQYSLVAVEYAVPINLRPLSAPPGFTGDKDVWKFDTDFGLWLLHAWVWEYNPDGVFKPNNPAVHVHQ